MRCITDNNHITWRNVVRESPDTGAHHLRSVEALLPECSVKKVISNAVVLEFHPCGLAEVPGREAYTYTVAPAERFEQVREAGHQVALALAQGVAEVAVISPQELAEVLSLTPVNAVLSQPFREDVQVGAAAEFDSGEPILNTEHLSEGKFERHTAGAAGVKQRVIDIEQDKVGQARARCTKGLGSIA